MDRVFSNSQIESTPFLRAPYTFFPVDRGRCSWYCGAMKIFEHNRAAWNALSKGTCRWAHPVDPWTVERARRGEWEVVLTPNRPVPQTWFGELVGSRVLCLASGGGQQAPVLAAAGAEVISFDLSEAQLAKDRQVAESEGLTLRCIQGNMADLSAFGEEEFDLVFNPVSTVFVPDVAPVWKECFRVLRPGGTLLSGFMNPSFFLFDHDPTPDCEPLEVRYRLPYSESERSTVSEARRAEIDAGSPMEFSHSLETLIGGQLMAGFNLVGLYEDWWSDKETPLNRHSPTSIATKAIRPFPWDLQRPSGRVE